MVLALKIVLMVIAVLICFFVVVQEGKNAGFGGAFTGQAGDTYYSKNKRHTKEGRLEMITAILGVLFFVISMMLNMSIFQ